MDSLVSCSQPSTLGNLLTMGTTAMVNQNASIPGGLISMAAPTSLPDHLVVVQNMNGNSNIEEEEPKTDIVTSASATVQNSIQASKVNNAPIGSTPLPPLIPAGTAVATPLAGMMGLSGIPHLTALTTLPGLGVVGQLAAPQMVQSSVSMSGQNAVGSNGTTTVITNSNAGNIMAANGQTAVQQVPPQLATQGIPQPQIATTPQFILAAGQPIQGIQGAQLLIPTSSGVATQQIITIPVTQLSGNQTVQLVASNGQIFTTTMANLQALSQPPSLPTVSAPNTATNSVQPQPMLTTGNFTGIGGQVTALPQFYTNAAGQLVAIGPQLIAHPIVASSQATNLVQMTPQLTTAQLQQQGQPPPQTEDKQTALSTVNAQTNGQTILTNKVQTAVPISAIPQNVTVKSQPAQISISPMSMTVAQRIQQGQGAVSPLTQAVQQQGISVTSTALDGNATSPSHQSNTISNTEANVVDGINLEEIKEFAKAFKIRRLSLGLTQTQVGQALSATEGPSYSQSAICRFEKLDITPKSAQKIKPVLERWMKEAEERYKNGAHTLTEFIGSETTKKRKRRTSFTPSALESLNQFFDKNTHPSGAEMTELAEKLNYDREVVRVWFCNKRQALKNTIKKLKGGTL